MELQSIKQRFNIIGDDPALNRALDIAVQVASTDLSVLVTGESGVGKEVIPQIIHVNSPRKHNMYIAVNCGAIPEGTIDSELFGHEKGSFTGALETRKGYFEVANGGTIFLDEVAELPLSTQVRLLRILQSGEFYKVGSSKVQKTDVRVVAATNINVLHAIGTGKFREDLYYRLNTVPITLPPLRERTLDIYQLFKKFALDFADKYKMPSIKLTRDAQDLLEQYRWPGNIRQLKNVAEQMSVLEKDRLIGAPILYKYLPPDSPEHLPVVNLNSHKKDDFIADRDIIYKILAQLRTELDDLKKELVLQKGVETKLTKENNNFLPDTQLIHTPALIHKSGLIIKEKDESPIDDSYSHFENFTEEPKQNELLSIPNVSKDLIKKCLEKHGGKRKAAAQELGISERTLYRKIKELEID